MPIQFRCQYCRQLLGISRSKAGSVVDCPACGRSLRVPGADGTIAVPEPVQQASADASLRTALEELRKLPTAISPVPVVSSVPAGSGRQNSQPQSAHKDAMRIVPLSPASPASPASRAEPTSEVRYSPADLPPEEDSPPLIIPELFDAEIPDHFEHKENPGRSPSAAVASRSETAFDLPDHLANALQDLGGHGPAASDEAETRAVSGSSRARRLKTLAGFAAIVSFLLGYVTARIQGTSQADVAPATNQPSSANRILPVVENTSGAFQTIRGSILFSDNRRGPGPDAGALILLLPSPNTSGLRLDARPLRNIEKSPAKEAIETALHVLGATLTRAADDGTFSLERRHAGPVTLVVISRHASRPEGEPVPPAIAAFLAEWFESPSHLTGRLLVQEKKLPAAGAGESDAPLEIVFGSAEK